MKHILKLTSFLMIMLFVAFISCKDEDPLPANSDYTVLSEYMASNSMDLPDLLTDWIVGAPTLETVGDFVLEARRNSRGIWIPGPVRRILLPKMFLEVPRNIEEIRRRDPSAARAWRTAVRRAFLRLFARGYEAVAFGPPPGGDAQRFGYTLARNTEPR